MKLYIYMFKANTKFNKHFEYAPTEKIARIQANKKNITLYSLISVL